MRFVKSLDDVAFGRDFVGHCDAITSILKRLVVSLSYLGMGQVGKSWITLIQRGGEAISQR